jgi:hypothetical protein
MKILVCTLTMLLMPLSVWSQERFSLGVNLDDNGAFVNIMNHTNRFSGAKGYDNAGFPTSDFDLVLMDARPVAEWSQAIDDPERYRVDVSGRYKGWCEGKADITVSGTAVSIENLLYDAVSNTTVFDIVVGGYPNANHGLVFMQWRNTRRTAQDTVGSGIKNIKIHRPGYELDTKKIFTDEYIRLCKAADFSCYRFYNVQNIWDGEPAFPAITSWQQRKLPTDVTQRPFTGKRDGWCWEYIIELANILQKDIWINIHISCDKDYIINLANLLKSSLHPNCRIYIENSNEVWSPTQATHGPYNNAQAQNKGISFDENYARRSVELSQWFAEVFGKEAIHTKIRCILAGQHGYHGRSDNHLRYIDRTFGPPKHYIYATSTALYFNAALPHSSAESVNNGMMNDITTQIENSNSAAYRNNHINKAREWELPGGCTSYEGGPHVPAGGGTANLGNAIQAHRTERMKNILEYNYNEGWKNLDGGLAMYFTLVSGYNRYGCWGLTDDYTKPERNYKMQAMRSIIGQLSSIQDYSNSAIFTPIIYPNPTGASMCIAGNNYDIVSVCTLMGEIIYTSEYKESQNIDVTHWSDGMYIVVYYRNGDIIETQWCIVRK